MFPPQSIATIMEQAIASNSEGQNFIASRSARR
jgi:hypothetical protein